MAGEKSEDEPRSTSRSPANIIVTEYELALHLLIVRLGREIHTRFGHGVPP